MLKLSERNDSFAHVCVSFVRMYLTVFAFVREFMYAWL